MRKFNMQVPDSKMDSFFCVFCNDNERMVVAESKNFKILCDDFPIVTGHLMIISKEHYTCAGDLPYDLLEELNRLKHNIRDYFSSISNKKVIFYEHGRAGSCGSFSNVNSDCEHFHLHCLPEDVAISNEVMSSFGRFNFTDYLQLKNYYFLYGNYLFFEDSLGKMYLYVVENLKVPSHYLRSLICKKLGYESRSNWKEYKENELAIASRKFLANISGII